MRSTYYPGVCTKPGTYYQGWFMYMRYTQGQNEEYLLSRSMYSTRYSLTKVHCVENHGRNGRYEAVCSVEPPFNSVKLGLPFNIQNLSSPFRGGGAVSSPTDHTDTLRLHNDKMAPGLSKIQIINVCISEDVLYVYTVHVLVFKSVYTN